MHNSAPFRSELQREQPVEGAKPRSINLIIMSVGNAQGDRGIQKKMPHVSWTAIVIQRPGPDRT
jgi:hypothetical protein